MPDTGIFATTAEVARRAGTKVSATSIAEAYVNDYMTQAESEINTITRFNWSDAYAGLNADTKGILKLAASSHAANSAILWDMSGFTSRVEAEDMINVNRDTYLRCIAILRDKKAKEFIEKA